MATIATSTVKRRPWRTILFTILAGLFALVPLANVRGLLAPWVLLGSPAPGYTPELHRWHSAMWGTLTSLLFGGSLLTVLWRPRTKPLVMQFVALTGIILFCVGTIAGDLAGLVLLAVFLVIVAVYPASRRLLDLSRPEPFSRPLLALSLLAAVLLAPNAWRNLHWQLAGVGGEHATLDHWIFSAVMDVILVLAGLLAATKRPGWRTLGIMAGLAFFYLGVASIALPYHDGSWGMIGGIVSAIGGLAFLAATTWEMRTSALTSGPLAQQTRRVPYLTALLAALALAAILVMVIPRWARSGSPTTAPTTGQPILTAQDFTFAPNKIHVKAGETVALPLDNRDGYAHQFDLDALNIHIPMPAGQTVLARFTPTQPGTYTFYCVLHANQATGQGMIGTLIVAP
jgi:plastocyanin